jgi:hypothetical protein
MKYPSKAGFTGVADIWGLEKPGYSSIVDVDVNRPIDGYDSQHLKVFYDVYHVLFYFVIITII